MSKETELSDEQIDNCVGNLGMAENSILVGPEEIRKAMRAVIAADRELRRFDAWFDVAYPASNHGRRASYLATGAMDLMRAAWQAATLAERERCAALIEYNAEGCSHMTRVILQSQIDAIREGGEPCP